MLYNDSLTAVTTATEKTIQVDKERSVIFTECMAAFECTSLGSPGMFSTVLQSSFLFRGVSRAHCKRMLIINIKK